jgi:hypothetical protein
MSWLPGVGKTLTLKKKTSMKKMIRMAAIACVAFVGTSAFALTINDAGVVGVHHGNLANSNPDTETVAAQKLLDMLANTIDGNFQTSLTEYAGQPTVVLSLGVQTLGAVTSVPAGHDYVMGKYDGAEGGYVLWYLGGAAVDLPATSATIWMNQAGKAGLGLSHFTVFNAVTTPEGGTTILLLGAGLFAISAVRRFIKS